MNMQRYSVTDVVDRFEEAAKTLHRLPRAHVQGHRNAWPEVIHSTIEILQMEPNPIRLGPPPAEAISRMEECFEWIFWLDNEQERRLIWLRAEKVYWKQICARIGCGRTKAWQLYTIALLKIVTRLNANQGGRT